MSACLASKRAYTWDEAYFLVKNFKWALLRVVVNNRWATAFTVTLVTNLGGVRLISFTLL